ncbi:MAG: alanyl-tRNA editing protein [Chlamydiales bacterium]|nr:alanyl-tRNA editing protein [Chlamydiales bacterium]
MTTPLYLSDAYLKEMDAMITEIDKEGDQQQRWMIVLDKTIFYPRGGGQATDQGLLFTDTWKGKVYQVLLKDGKTIHYVEGDQPPPVGASLKGALDWNRRYLNMRLHSAGHVVDFALYLLGYSPSPLMPFKGDHEKKPVIYYQGTVEEDFREALEKKANDLVEQNLPFSVRFVDHEELEREAIYLQPGLPKNKPLRLLTLKGVGGVADGGTQVRSTFEVGHISILPIEKKDGMTLIHYRLT